MHNQFTLRKDSSGVVVSAKGLVDGRLCHAVLHGQQIYFFSYEGLPAKAVLDQARQALAPVFLRTVSS